MAEDVNGVSLEAGDRVYWEDPDEGLCSGFCTVTTVDVPYGSQAVTLEEDGGGLVKAYAWECKKVIGNGNDRVDKANQQGEKQ